MLIDFALLLLSLFSWMPTPLDLFAVGVFGLLCIIFGLKFLAFIKSTIPFF